MFWRYLKEVVRFMRNHNERDERYTIPPLIENSG